MTLHIYTSHDRKRVRRKCPYHKHLCYGEEARYYDTTSIFFDCGTSVDYGYGEWRPPENVKCPKCRKWFRPLEMGEHLKTVHNDSIKNYEYWKVIKKWVSKLWIAQNRVAVLEKSIK